MTGRTPCFAASLVSSTAPASEPWSVRATAGISNSAARAASAGIRQAPSRIEYSEWTCRWTKDAEATAEPFFQALRPTPGICAARGLDSTRMPEDRSVAIALTGVSKRFGRVGAVENVTLAIGEGEFFS